MFLVAVVLSWVIPTGSYSSDAYTNNGTIPVVVRATFTESWKKDNSELDLKLDNNEDSVIKYINDDWYKIGNYYYYKSVLNKGDATSSLIDSVLFNTNTEIISDCNSNDSGNNCLPTTKYTDARYRIEVTFDTLQASVYEDEWNVSLNSKPLLEDIKKKSTYDDIESKYVEDTINYDLISSDKNGQGIYSTNSSIPTYFYRGNVNSNNVLIDNYCFKIINTNSNGINMIYNGNLVNNKCDNNYLLDSISYDKDVILNRMDSWYKALNKNYIKGSYLLTKDDLKLVGVIEDKDNNTYLSSDNNYFVSDSYLLGKSLVKGNSANIRPVIVVDSSVNFSEGNGEENSPYILK